MDGFLNWWRSRITHYALACSLDELHRKVDDIMATQEDLNALVARIDNAVTGIRADIETLKAQHPELDLSGLESRVADLEGLDAQNPAPEPTPELGDQP